MRRLLAVLALVGVAALAGLGGSLAFPAPAAKATARAYCLGGQISEGPDPDGGHGCKSPGGPEPPNELGVADQQRGAILTAGSGPLANGAYAQAVAYRNSLPNAAAGTASGWQLQGKGPLFAGGAYDAVGSPFPQTIKDLGLRNLTGRITDLAYDPAPQWQGKRIFASAAEGGVWESRDGGGNWSSIGDTLITQSVGAIAWEPNAPAGVDDGTLIVGTGDNAQGRYNYSGHGVFFSNDDGRTWQAASPNVTDPSQNFRIRISPNDPHRVYAATSKGLFQGVFASDYSGLAFHNLNLPTTPAGYGANCSGTSAAFPCFLANNVTDVEVRTPDAAPPPPAAIPLAPAPRASTAAADVVVASVGTRFGDRPYLDATGKVATAFKQTPQAGIYRSPSCEATTCTFGYVIPPGAPGNSNPPCSLTNDVCFPLSDHVGRVSLAAAHGTGQLHSVLYALVHDPVKEDNCFDDFDLPVGCRAGISDPVLGLPTPGNNFSTAVDGMYFSQDFGLTWTKNMDWAQLNLPFTNSSLGSVTGNAPFGYGPGIQSSFNNWVLVDPTSTDNAGQPTRLLFGLEEIWATNPLYAGTLTGATPPYKTGWREQTATSVGNPPWEVIGRYWSACGPLTFGEGVNCNTVNVSNLGGANTTTHPDQHAAMLIPGANGLQFFAGSDGGVFNQAINSGHPQFDNNAWGEGTSSNMNVLQFYNAEISKDGTIVGGLQDNGEAKFDPKSGQMSEVFGGDGTMSAIDPDNSKNIMESYVHGIASVTSNGGLSWTNIDPGLVNPRFDAPLQMDPRDAKHFLTGGRNIMERVVGYQGTTPAWTQVYDLGTTTSPGDANAKPPNPNSPGVGAGSDNSATAVDISGANAYVGFCGLCDVMLEGIPFSNGIATNVGGSQPPQINTGNGWHIAKAQGLPKRYITSVRMDPSNPDTIFVTEGGYQRVWVPPGMFGEAVDPAGGHVFKSTDHGEHFTDISGNLPNTPAMWSVIHGGKLVVATDIGVFISGDTQGASYSQLGTMPAAPVNTLRIAPGNPDLVIAATWGRGVYAYCFSGAVCPSNIYNLPQTSLPNSAAVGQAGLAVVPPAIVILVLFLVARRRRAHAEAAA